MNTVIKKINQPYEDIGIIKEAAGIIAAGGLVAFPTETVYGLGANGLNPEAVKKIYEAKGRPSDNPLILHIASMEMLNQIAAEMPEKAKHLAEAFWPGPLTMLFKKKSIVPNETSNLDTVGIRFPSNKIASLLIKEAGVPIAAPSANSSGKPSPTKASHVEFDLSGRINMILDGGACDFGVESTVVDITGDVPVILRPGSITPEMIREVAGEVLYGADVREGESPRAPGMKYTHYSPVAEVKVVLGEPENTAQTIIDMVKKNKNIKVGILATEETKSYYSELEDTYVMVCGTREAPEVIAANLFKMLRRFDHLGIGVVYAEGIEEDGVGLAVMNRLKKAAQDIYYAR